MKYSDIQTAVSLDPMGARPEVQARFVVTATCACEEETPELIKRASELARLRLVMGIYRQVRADAIKAYEDLRLIIDDPNSELFRTLMEPLINAGSELLNPESK